MFFLLLSPGFRAEISVHSSNFFWETSSLAGRSQVRRWPWVVSFYIIYSDGTCVRVYFVNSFSYWILWLTGACCREHVSPCQVSAAAIWEECPSRNRGPALPKAYWGLAASRAAALRPGSPAGQGGTEVRQASVQIPQELWLLQVSAAEMQTILCQEHFSMGH